MKMVPRFARFRELLRSSGGSSGWQRSPIEEIRPGDVVWFAPSEKHWHGASATTALTHIALQEKLDGKVVEWLEYVSDEQYKDGVK